MEDFSFPRIVFGLQAAISCLGIFIGVWGFAQHAKCLWVVLTRKYLTPNEAHCIKHAYTAMVCLACVVMAFARLNTIGFLIFGTLAAGLTYIAGMLIMVVTIGLAIWSKEVNHQSQSPNSLNWGTPVANSPTLARILTALLIITLAFIGVGLVSIGN